MLVPVTKEALPDSSHVVGMTGIAGQTAEDDDTVLLSVGNLAIRAHKACAHSRAHPQYLLMAL